MLFGEFGSSFTFAKYVLMVVCMSVGDDFIVVVVHVKRVVFTILT